METAFGDLFLTRTPVPDIVLRMAAAVVLGGVIGLDREVRRKAAGLRTHMLVSLAAAAFAVITFELVHTFAAMGAEAVRADPTRVIEAVVAGVAFLGAGSIIRSSGSVKGITTGASIWLCGAIGLACGSGYFAVALILFGFGVLILMIVGWLEHKMEVSDGE